jgi:hypothetical protein
MAQTPERRMYLMWRAAKKRSQHDYYRKRWCHSPLMQVAVRFGVPVRHVRAVVAAQRTSQEA